MYLKLNKKYIYLTFILRVRVEYEMADSQLGA